MDFLGRTEKGIGWLADNAESAADLYLLAEESIPLATEIGKEITRMWRQAKAEGKAPPAGQPWSWKSLRKLYGPKTDTEGVEDQIAAKEKERSRLIERMGLLVPEAAALAADRVNLLSGELRALRDRLSPAADRLEGVRGTLRALLEQTRLTREALESGFPKQKAEAVRRFLSRIVVKHRERKAGTQRRSEIVEVVITPQVGPSEAFPGENVRARG